MNKLLKKKGTSKKQVNEEGYYPEIKESKKKGEEIIKLSIENIIKKKNILTSKIQERIKKLKKEEVIPIILFNSLNWDLINETVCIKGLDRYDFIILNEKNNLIDFQFNYFNNFTFNLFFNVNISSFGFFFFFIQKLLFKGKKI
jgi:hypothetical protein